MLFLGGNWRDSIKKADADSFVERPQVCVAVDGGARAGGLRGRADL